MNESSDLNSAIFKEKLALTRWNSSYGKYFCFHHSSLANIHWCIRSGPPQLIFFGEKSFKYLQKTSNLVAFAFNSFHCLHERPQLNKKALGYHKISLLRKKTDWYNHLWCFMTPCSFKTICQLWKEMINMSVSTNKSQEWKASDQSQARNAAMRTFLDLIYWAWRCTNYSTLNIR